MEFVILTGLSGAGKTNALHAMEDIGFYCVDNLPPLLLDTFYDLCENATDTRMKRVAVVADARSGEMFGELSDVLQKAKLDGKRFKTLFLDAKLDTLVIRYKETRRKHPLSGEMVSGSVEEAVELDDYATGEPHTAHTSNLVPLVLIGRDEKDRKSTRLNSSHAT